jgi:hypothetical protein
MLINPGDGERAAAQDIMDRLRAEVRRARRAVDLQPVQDLTTTPRPPTEAGSCLGAIPSRSRFQRPSRRATNVPEVANVVSIDRARRRRPRHGIAARRHRRERRRGAHSAFGQRVISTIFTDTNQHAILEEKPGVVTAPQDLTS